MTAILGRMSRETSAAVEATAPAEATPPTQHDHPADELPLDNQDDLP
jgi:hypothetical protein